MKRLEVITGSEGDTGEPKLNALVTFYNAFNNRNRALMKSSWANDAGVVMSNPLGGVKRGWGEISEVYERIFSGQTKVFVEFYEFTLRGSDEMFVAVGRERGFVRTPDQTIELKIRTSRVFQRVDGEWKQIHHHGSIDDSHLLELYQEAVIKK